MPTFVADILLVFLFIGTLVILVMMLTELINFIQTRVPFVPTARKDIVDMVSRVGITSTDYVYDLGSGNGKVVFTVSNLTGARTKGFQRSGWTQWYAQLKNYFRKSAAKQKSSVELVTGNFFDHSWSDATVIYGYLYPFLMRSVAEKALEDCRPGTKLVIRDFYLPNLSRLIQLDSWQTPTGHTIYLYEIH